MPKSAPARTQAERADQARARILDAAVREFSENGLAGARTEHIAEAAGVNKALLYYYFQNKEALYTAALESVAEQVVAHGMAALHSPATAGERVVRFALHHFDRIHSQRPFQTLMQHEMMRLHRGEESALAFIVDRVFRPTMGPVEQLIAEGQRAGELVRTDPWQMMYAALGANVFYFLSAPVMEHLTGKKLFERAALRARRKAAVEHLGQTIFVDRRHGARVAARVLADIPMPRSGEFKPQEKRA